MLALRDGGGRPDVGREVQLSPHLVVPHSLGVEDKMADAATVCTVDGLWPTWIRGVSLTVLGRSSAGQ